MHTTRLSKGNAHHNGDFSGDVRFTRIVNNEIVEFEVPNEDLLELVGAQMKMRAISELEQSEGYNIDDVSVIEKMTGREFLEMCTDKHTSIVKLSYNK